MRFPRKRRYRGPGGPFPRRPYPFARQYRSWENLAVAGPSAALVSDVSSNYFIGAGIRARIPASSITSGMVGDPADILGSPGVLGAFPQTSSFGFTNVFPLWTPLNRARHGGQDITLKALYGYLLPIQVKQIDASGTVVGAGNNVMVRVCLAQMEMREEDMVRGVALNNFDVWSNNDLNRHRIRWMRDWPMTLDHSISQNRGTYWTDSPTTNASKGTGNEPLLAGLMGGPRVRMPRLNMRLMKDRPLVLILGISGNIPMTNFAVAGADPNDQIISSGASLQIRLFNFLRAFLKR